MHMDDERIVGRSAFGAENFSTGRRFKRVCGKAIYGFRGNSDHLPSVQCLGKQL
jgi:hypothetical protein